MSCFFVLSPARGGGVLMWGGLWSAAMGGVVEPISMYSQELVAESCMVFWNY